MPTTLIVTNDFPPRVGGIESFVADVVGLLDSDVLVYTCSPPGATAFDRSHSVEVVRAGRVLLPTAAATRQAASLLRSSGASRVIFGAAAPLGLMARSLRRAGATHILALSHGHETWWAGLPGSRSLLHRVGDDVDHLSTISDFTASRIAPVLSPSARARMIRLAPPVSSDLFCPAELAKTDESQVRAIAVGRLVRQKGFDTLLQAWRLVLDRWPRRDRRPELVVVGDGPQRRRLQQLSASLDLARSVRWLGALPRSAVISELQQAEVFALPVRTRFAGLNPEGLGLAALEAAACGLPVLVGDSGGAPETVRPGQTGFVVDPDSPAELASRLLRLLGDPVQARILGEAGRRFVTETFGSDRARQTLRAALGLDDSTTATAPEPPRA